MKIIYALGVESTTATEVSNDVTHYSYYEHYYESMKEAHKALYYYQYVLNRNAFLDEIEIEESFDNKIPSKMYVEAKFNYRNNSCRYDHISLSIYPKVFSTPKSAYENQEVKVLKSDRCGVHSSNVTMFFIINTIEGESREELENRCKEKVKDIYESYVKGE